MPATAHDRRWATHADGSGRRTAPAPAGPNARQAAPEQSPPPKKGLLRSKKFVLAVVAVLALGGGGYYKFLRPHATPPPAGGTVVPLTSTTLNLAKGHYLKISIAIQLVKGSVPADEFSTSHAAQLMIDEFSNRTVASISSGAARNKLRADLLAKVKHAYPGEVYDLFLTEFVTQ
jgi:flagellar FliL protein